MRKANIKDVSAKAGVSIKTVSRVINNEPNVRAKTAALVREAIKELDYVPSHSARDLKSNRSYLIGVLGRTSRSDYFSDIQYGAMEACHSHGFHLLVSYIENYEDLDQAALEKEIDAILTSSDLAALILPPPFGDNDIILARLEKADIPAFLISPKIPPENGYFVTFDEEAAAYDIVKHLIDLGHRDIALIQGLQGYGATEWRTNGYLRALAEANIPKNNAYIMQGDFHFQSGFDCTQTLLAMPNRPTAIFCANDDMAAGAHNAALQAGIKIPDDLSLAGFDDNSIASKIWPGLTTIHQPAKALGTMSAELAIHTVQKNQDQNNREAIPYEMIIRGSTRKPSS